MVVLVTSNSQGGIIQFTMQLLRSLKEIVNDCVAFFPMEAVVDRESELIKRYRKVKSINPFKKLYDKIAEDILAYSPDLVIFTDDGLTSAQILLRIHKSVRTVLCSHDVSVHSTHKPLKQMIKNALIMPPILSAYRKASKIVLMSNNSRELFIDKYKCYSNKAVILTLGAHPPEVKSKIPNEFSDLGDDKFFLFFGRMDKYKGIHNLLKAYEQCKDDKPPKLVLAGNGLLTTEEESCIRQNKQVILLKRYIQDSEMIWLFEHALTVVLPYIDASQSGVLPIAYHYNIPVIVSSLPGLTEFVVNGETGLIFTSVSELASALSMISNDEIHSKIKKSIPEYYRKNFDWNRNIKEFLKIVE